VVVVQDVYQPTLRRLCNSNRQKKGDDLNGSAIRQDYFETIIKWISNDNIEKHMAEKQHQPNANEINRESKPKMNEGKFYLYCLNESKFLVFLPLY